MKIFIGSSAKNRIEEKVLIESIRKSSKNPIQIFVFLADQQKLLESDGKKYISEKPLPSLKDLSGATRFSLVRFMIPKLCEFQGKALYLDSDQLVFSDVASVFEDLRDKAVSAVPLASASSRLHYRRDTIEPLMKSHNDPYLSSVMAMDCEQLRNWDVERILSEINGRKLTYSQVMFLCTEFQNRFNFGVNPLPSEWNHLDVLNTHTKLVHFTDLKTQPWIFGWHPHFDVWEKAFFECVEAGAITDTDLSYAVQNRFLDATLAKASQLKGLGRERMRLKGKVFGFSKFLRHHLREVLLHYRNRFRKPLTVSGSA